MDVLYLTDRISRRGGADHHLLQVAEWAVDAGHRVAIVAGRVREPPSWMDGLRVQRMRGLADRFDSSSVLFALAPLLARADVVHVQNVMNPAVLAAATATGRALVTVQDHRVFCPGPGRTLSDGSPCVSEMSDSTCAGCLPEEGYRARMLMVTRARRDAVRGATLVVLSRYMADELAAAGLPGAAVVPPWFEVLDGEPEPGDGFLLGGRLVAHKAPRDGWDAWRRSGCGMALRIAGAGPLERELEGTEPLGWLTASELASQLRRSRALLFPSRWQEPFGLLGVEALGQATPVVVMRTGGTTDWSDEGCVVIESGDIDGMAGAIGALARDQELAMALGRRGRAMVGDRFSKAAIAPRLERLYRSVAEAAGRAV